MDVEKLIDLMKRERVLRVKMGGLEVELSPMAFAPDAPPAADKTALPAVPSDFTLYSVQDQSPLAVYTRAETEESPS